MPGLNTIQQAYPGDDRNAFIQKAVTWANRFDTFCFLNSNDFPGQTLLAAGSVSQITGEDTNLESLDLFRTHLKGKAYGFLSYDINRTNKKAESEQEPRIAFPKFQFSIPEFEIEFKAKLFIFSARNVLGEAITDDQLKQTYNDTFYLIQQTVPEKNRSPLHKVQIAYSQSKTEYLTRVNKIQDHIHRGDVYELTFCQEFFINQAHPEPISAYFNLNQISPAPFSSLLKTGSKYILSSSMERFLSLKSGNILSQPIKGTAARGATHEQDESQKKELLESEKERAENVMIVDLVRNDLSQIATKGSVKIESLFELQSFAQVHQLVSSISADLKADTPLSHILKACFPMGSMTGAPKIRAMELIDRYEKRHRGLFSGSVGWMDAHDLDLSVLIRTAFYDSAQHLISFSTGSAITAASVPEDEYQECLLKAQSLLQAFAFHSESLADDTKQ